jgi:hypothetical protein
MVLGRVLDAIMMLETKENVYAYADTLYRVDGVMRSDLLQSHGGGDYTYIISSL